MALNESASFMVSLILAVLTFSSMQILRPQLAASQLMTILGGFMGSLFFVLLLTALGNLEKTLFGRGFAAKWVEVVLCLAASTSASATVHRVSATTNVLFSLIMLYTMNKLSQEIYGTGNDPRASAPAGNAERSKKRK